MYWSTIDARKRVMYTCTITEHRPSDIVSECRQKMADVRIVHDPDHPDFDPFKLAEFEALEALERLKRNTGLTIPSSNKPMQLKASRHNSADLLNEIAPSRNILKMSAEEKQAEKLNDENVSCIANESSGRTEEQQQRKSVDLTVCNLKRLSASTLRQLGLQTTSRLSSPLIDDQSCEYYIIT